MVQFALAILLGLAVFLVISPEDKPELHLQVLMAISKFLASNDVRAELRNARNEAEAVEIIREYS